MSKKQITLNAILKELLNNNKISSMSSYLLYFKCSGGHLTPCNTPKHRLFYCKECKRVLPKQQCDRYTDKITALKQYSKSQWIEHKGKRLYKYPESFRRNYRKKKEEVNPT